MFEVELDQAIMKFVRAFHVVKKRHIIRFFSDWNENANRVLDYLLVMNRLHELPGEYISTVRKVYGGIEQYGNQCMALDLLCGTLKAGDVKWFAPADYPMDIRFLTTDDELFDVSVIDTNWVNKYALLPIAWKKGLPKDMEDDCFNHIAVVPNLELAHKVQDLDFTQFAVVDSNGGCQMYDVE